MRLSLTMDQRHKLELAHGEISSIIFLSALLPSLVRFLAVVIVQSLNVISRYNE